MQGSIAISKLNELSKYVPSKTDGKVTKKVDAAKFTWELDDNETYKGTDEDMN